jgi:hypothetical protein
LGLYFSDFPMIFYGIYNFQQLTKHYLRCNETPESFRFLTSGPWFADRPLEITGDSQLGPRAPADGGPA